jgi:hypothetical protein
MIAQEKLSPKHFRFVYYYYHRKLLQFFFFFLLLDPQGNGIRVVKAPKLVKILPMEKMLPFEIDQEYADFAVKAIPDLSKLSKKVRIFVHRWRCVCFKIFQRLKGIQD